MSDTSRSSFSGDKHNEPSATTSATVVFASGPTPSTTATALTPRVHRQSKLKGMISRSISGKAGSTVIDNTEQYEASRRVIRPNVENYESTRLQQEHQAVLKKIEATTSRARKEMEKIRKEALIKENKVRAEIEHLTMELNMIEAEQAKKIKAVQEKEANELEKLVKALKRI